MEGIIARWLSVLPDTIQNDNGVMNGVTENNEKRCYYVESYFVGKAEIGQDIEQTERDNQIMEQSDYRCRAIIESEPEGNVTKD